MERIRYHTGVYDLTEIRRSQAITDCASGRVWDGSITRSMNQSHIFSSSSESLTLR